MTTSPPKVRKAEERDLLYFITPELWPLHPFLALVRYRPDGEMDCGILYDVRDKPQLAEYRFTVLLTNIFHLPKTEDEFLALPSERFENVEALAEAGWVVD